MRAAVEVLADDSDVASTVRRHIRPDPRGGVRPGAGRPRRTWLTAPEAATSIRDELHAGDEVFAMRIVARLIADLRALERPGDIARCLASPRTTGDRRWDTLLAVAVGRECRRKGLAPPAWANPTPLPSWWFPLLADPILTARTMQRTPVDFAARGIWLDATALETLRRRARNCSSVTWTSRRQSRQPTWHCRCMETRWSCCQSGTSSSSRPRL